MFTGIAGRQLHPGDRPQSRRRSGQQIRAGEVPRSGPGELRFEEITSAPLKTVYGALGFFKISADLERNYTVQ